jgi:hypothetical protein
VLGLVLLRAGLVYWTVKSFSAVVIFNNISLKRKFSYETIFECKIQRADLGLIIDAPCSPRSSPEAAHCDRYPVSASRPH